MIRSLAALLRRDAEPDLPECRVMDGYVFGNPDDFPCRDAATRRVAFHCPGCGQRERVVCDFHEQVIAKDLGTCEVCEAAGDHGVPVTYLRSGPTPICDGNSGDEVSR